MAEEVKQTPTPQEADAKMAAFLDWLKQRPAELAKLLAIVVEFYRIQGQVVTPNPPPATVPDGPMYVRPNQPPALLTVPISPEELDAMMEDRADAQVKERAITFLKGFLTGLLVAAAI
jgi:hypothetical protein